LEQIREIISLADELTGDFRRVRDQFDQINRKLREQLIDNEGSRGGVLDSVFAGYDQIDESEAGKHSRLFGAYLPILNSRQYLMKHWKILCAANFSINLN